ncbi:hypothetical protein QOZ80_9BG0714850 [Eleusine coracana subsp. coracana]|nr:hypothetical protein QOZ80_9BG0714850 [Eleusine coracana subsp. coracana]
MATHPTKPCVLTLHNGGQIELWNEKNTWEWERTQSFDDSENVLQIVFNPMDANSFATASKDSTIKICSLSLPNSIRTLYGHTDHVNCLDYFTNADQQYLISGSADRTAKIWDLQQNLCVETLHAFVTAVTSVCCHPSLPLLITGSEYGLVHFWCSATFRIMDVLDIGFGPVVGLRCVDGSGRIVIGQQERLAVLELGEEESVTN